MHRLAPVALATLLAATAPAHVRAHSQTHFADPANLAGERVRPRDGRELPIDGGIGSNGQPDNALGLAQMLRKLNTRASLMLIVAHPDDEDGGMLTYYSRGLGARVAVLTLTRGEGGQNAMTGDFEDALGLLRTQELLSADRYMGIDQFFGTEVDFGFSKTKSEAFAKWGHDRVLYDAVRAVRIYRPLVIAAVFSGAVTDGHGQHQVSGQIAQEVFKAAGDPTIFPELTREGILPWQPLKVYARVPFSRVTAQGLYDYATGQTVPAEFTNYVTGQTFTTAPTPDVTINEGQTDPLLTWSAGNLSDLRAKPSNPNEQISYVQFARIGLGLQRSQIGGGERVPPAGRVDVSYHLYGSRVCAPGLPNPTPKLCSSANNTSSHHPNSVILSQSSLTRAANSNAVILSDRSEAKGVEEPRGSESSHNRSPLLHLVSQPLPSNDAAPSKAPTARSITAQGNALGDTDDEETSAEGAPYNPTPVNQPNFFDGIDTSLAGIESLDKGDHYSADIMFSLERHIQYATTHFDPAHPEAIAPQLADALDDVEKQIQLIGAPPNPTPARANLLHELSIKRAQLNEALALSLGLSLDAAAKDENLALGSSSDVALSIVETSIQPVNAVSHGIQGPDNGPGKHRDTDNEQLSPNHPFQRTGAIDASRMRDATRPYFFRTNIEQPFYELREPNLRNAPQTPPPYVADVTLNYRGTDIDLLRTVHSGPQSVSIVPQVSITLDSHAAVVPQTERHFSTEVHVKNVNHHPIDGTLQISRPVGWDITPREVELSKLPPQESRTISVQLQPALSWSGPGGALSAIVSAGDPKRAYTEGFRPVGYGTLPRTNYYTPATLRVVPVDLKLPPENKRRIAYLPGTGDDVPAALASIGLTPTLLKVSDLTADKLKAFDTVILGVRTYNAHPDLHGAPTQALFDFARNGGNVVVQYQTPEFSAADAPYPLTTHNERVVDETAPVQLLDPSSPLLTTPNKITSADFNNWIEERGHGFLDTWDQHYTALTETHDPGAPAEHIQPQAPQRGGLITVQLGKGRWTYCAFALYRQLPEAVPGAFRLFVNLLNP